MDQISNSTPEPTVTLDQALMSWNLSKQVLESAKAKEMEARKLAFSLGFGANAKEGTTTKDLGNGYTLKGVKKINYNIVKPEGFDGNVIQAVNDCLDAFNKISPNEGSFIGDRIFKYSVDISLTEYRLLVEDAKSQPYKQKMLDEVNKILEIKEAAPTLEIKEPKK